jgi:hypothetical protein
MSDRNNEVRNALGLDEHLLEWSAQLRIGRTTLRVTQRISQCMQYAWSNDVLGTCSARGTCVLSKTVLQEPATPTPSQTRGR